MRKVTINIDDEPHHDRGDFILGHAGIVSRFVVALFYNIAENPPRKLLHDRFAPGAEDPFNMPSQKRTCIPKEFNANLLLATPRPSRLTVTV